MNEKINMGYVSIGIIMFLMAIAFVVATTLTYEEKVIGLTDCFDNEWNKIIDLKCEETTYYRFGMDGEWFDKITIIPFIIWMIIMIIFLFKGMFSWGEDD